MEKFITAQDKVYTDVIRELKNHKKESHWMWYIFPQIDGLGSSPTAGHYAIKDRNQAIEYLENPILRSRLFECTQLMLDIDNKSAYDVLGFPDDLKLKSSMTLFASISPQDSVFHKVIDKFFNGQMDQKTLDLLS